MRIYKWLQMIKKGYQWLQMITNGSKWLQLATNDYKWLQIVRQSITDPDIQARLIANRWGLIYA